jgi:hypothetical protein
MSAIRRTVLTWAAFGVWLLVVLIETGGGHVLGDATPLSLQGSKVTLEYPSGGAVGWGIPYLAFVDGVLLFALFWRAASYVLRGSLQVKVQVVTTIIGGILFLIAAVLALLAALTVLILMVSLVAATPFGLIAYLGIWGGFPTGTAAATLSSLMFVKLVAIVLLLVADLGMLGHKMLVLFFLLSLVATAVLSFLHGLVPMPFVAITDVVGALIAGVIGIVLGLIVVIGSLPALVKVVLRSVGEAKSAAD